MESDNTSARTKGDVAHSITKAGLGSVPIVGAAAAELFGLVVSPPLEKRQARWREQIGEAISGLEGEIEEIADRLSNDDEFIDTLVQASRAAVASSDEEKRKALVAAVVNTAKGQSPDEADRAVFVQLVDRWTVWHLRLVFLFADPVQWYEQHGISWPEVSIGGSLMQLVEKAFPSLKGQKEFVEQVWRDIYGAGLTRTQSLSGMMTGSGMAAQRLTDRGAAFLDLIRADTDVAS